MESILPDLNTAYIGYRKKCAEAYLSEEWLSAYGALRCSNNLLPVDLRIVIDDDEYLQKIRQDTLCTCNHCYTDYPIDKNNPDSKMESRPTEHIWNTIRTYQMDVPFIIAFISGNKKEECWTCSTCKQRNRSSKTIKIEQRLKKPFILGVMPNEPKRQDGISNLRYGIEARKYIWQFTAELEAVMGEYRRNYQPKDQNNDILNGDPNSEDLETSWN